MKIWLSIFSITVISISWKTWPKRANLILYTTTIMWKILFKKIKICTLSLSCCFFLICVTQMRHMIKYLICHLYISNPHLPCMNEVLNVLNPEKKFSHDLIALKSITSMSILLHSFITQTWFSSQGGHRGSTPLASLHFWSDQVLTETPKRLPRADPTGKPCAADLCHGLQQQLTG